ALAGQHPADLQAALSCLPDALVVPTEKGQSSQAEL
ncbi:hypothetical protein A2U01_0056612, partial [Trifolium medium]|nr:hypothetical protein [Trifolium medium]